MESGGQRTSVLYGSRDETENLQTSETETSPNLNSNTNNFYQRLFLSDMFIVYLNTQFIQVFFILHPSQLFKSLF